MLVPAVLSVFTKMKRYLWEMITASLLWRQFDFRCVPRSEQPWKTHGLGRRIEAEHVFTRRQLQVEREGTSFRRGGVFLLHSKTHRGDLHSHRIRDVPLPLHRQYDAAGGTAGVDEAEGW